MNKKTIRIIIAVILFLLILLYFFGCQNNTQAKMEAQNIEIVKTAWSEWSNHNIEFFYDFYDQEDYKYYAPFINTEPESFEEIISGMEKVWTNYPDITFSIENIFASGDLVVTMLVIKATHTQEIENRPPPTGQELEFSSINIVRFESGKVVEEWENTDLLGFLKQLGYELKN